MYLAHGVRTMVVALGVAMVVILDRDRVKLAMTRREIRTFRASFAA